MPAAFAYSTIAVYYGTADVELNRRNGRERLHIQAEETTQVKFKRMAGHLRHHMCDQPRDRLAEQAFQVASRIRHFMEDPVDAFALPVEPAVPCGVVRRVLMGSLGGP